MTTPNSASTAPMLVQTAPPVQSAPPVRAPQKSPLKAILAGGFAGAVEAFVTHPLEFLKVQLQLFEEKAKLGLLRCARQTVTQDGFLGLYRGLSPMLLFAIPKSATRFSCYEILRNKLQRPDGTLSTTGTLFCGLASGAAEAVVAVTPMDTLKVKLIHDQLTRLPSERRYRGLLHGVRTIVAEQGIGGVYKGLTATLIKQSTNQAIRWLVYVRAKEWMAGGADTSRLGVLHTVAASLLAATASVLGNAPVDVVKTRLQGLQSHKYAGVLDCAAKIARHEGAAGFYKGTAPRLARVCVETVVLMVLYEQATVQLDALWPEDD